MHCPRPIFFATVLMLALGCASSPDDKPQWVEAAGSDIAANATFGWESGAAPPASILDNQIRDAIRGELTGRGYVESADAPDFLIHHETFEQSAVKESNPVRLGIGLGSWGGSSGGSVGTSMDVGGGEKIVQQIRILVRALEPGSDTELWLGRTAPISEQPDAEAVGRAMAGLLKEFPARRTE